MLVPSTGKSSDSSSSSSSSADGELLAELHRSAEQRGRRRCGSTLRALRKQETREQRPIGLSVASPPPEPPETFTHDLSVNSFTSGGTEEAGECRSLRARGLLHLQLSASEPLAGKVCAAQETVELETLSALLIGR